MRRVRELEAAEHERLRAMSVRSAMLDISEASHRAPNLEALYAHIHRVLTGILPVENFYIALYQPENERFQFVYAHDATDRYDREPVAMPRSMTSIVMHTGRPLLVDRTEYRRLIESGAIHRIGSEPASWLGVPLVTEGRPIGVMAVQSYQDEHRYSADDEQVLSFVSEQVAAAIERRRAREARDRYMQEIEIAYERIRRDLQIASRVQQALMPAEPPTDIPGLAFFWVFDACDEVAGDMFNIIRLDDDHVAFHILDVSGHGVPAALTSVGVDRALSAPGMLTFEPSAPGAPRVIAPPHAVCQQLNQRFPPSTVTFQFFTFLYAVVQLSTRRMQWSRAGHHAPVVVRGGVPYRLDGPAGPSIGIMSEAAFTTQSFQLEPGDRLILHTDGVDEARNDEQELFGEDEVLKMLMRGAGAPLEDAVRALHDSVLAHCDNHRRDDVTILGIEVLADARPPASH